MTAPVQLRKLRTAEQFRAHLGELGISLPFDDIVDPAGPLAQRHEVGGLQLRNRFAILPMEGWDGTEDGRPTELVRRRWRRFGAGGAALVWGGEAVAVRPEARANPHQLCIGPQSDGDLAELRALLDDDQHAGLQLTHSGRFSLAPVAAGPHPVLDRRHPAPVIGDDDLKALVDAYRQAAARAAGAGFDFVDVKACHGYLVHELLGAVDRPGPFGGDFEGRTRLLREVVEAAAGEIAVGVRLSAFDVVPFDNEGRPEEVPLPYQHAFGGDGSGTGVDLAEPVALVHGLAALGVRSVCVSAGSPYYSPHVQRPAYFPPSDGYPPPEDPLAGVARLVDAAAAIKASCPDVAVVGSGWSYLQEWLPHVAQAAVREGLVDVIGLGRMALSYPDLPADVLAGRRVDGRRLCRTFSDCTTAPRAGLVSGCWPLDPEYKSRPDRHVLVAAKRASRTPAGDDA